jgi:hypothetical protein
LTDDEGFEKMLGWSPIQIDSIASRFLYALDELIGLYDCGSQNRRTRVG